MILFNVCTVVWMEFSIFPHTWTHILHYANELFLMTCALRWNVKTRLQKVWSVCAKKENIYVNTHVIIIWLLAACVDQSTVGCQEFYRKQKTQHLSGVYRLNEFTSAEIINHGKLERFRIYWNESPWILHCQRDLESFEMTQHSIYGGDGLQKGGKRVTETWLQH